MKNAVFGHTSFIKVVINGTITNNRSKTPHDSIENPAVKDGAFVEIEKESPTSQLEIYKTVI